MRFPTVSTSYGTIEYALIKKESYINPPWRSGSFVYFHAKRIQAITGHLVMHKGASKIPLEFVEGRIKQGTETIAVPTGRGGEFYIENLTPGTYKTVVNYEAGTCELTLDIPQSKEMFVDIGDVRCEPLSP